MSIERIAPEALRLPVRDRALLAASLWESIDDPNAADISDDEAVALAIVREKEIESGAVSPVSHSELMRRLRK